MENIIFLVFLWPEVWKYLLEAIMRLFLIAVWNDKRDLAFNL